ncbi:hypothetical protein MIMGU_mgv1a025978mg [Erythranthe guttata]|uniref:Terpene synthase metal-binding domain-containing protein n=1 Tax=Erythranthe guttata TaxID=4155 RepID=A0A022PUE5_ERYGU|nr:hypothetical protein MIMGU_mgv1a025978mg [Erythranthe guttata]
MKVVYQFTMSVYQDYECDAAKQDKSFALPCFIETVKQISRAYNQELKWVTGRKMPSFDEYISNVLSTSCLYVNVLSTSCLYVLLSAVVVGMKSVDKETIDWLLSYPKIVVSAAKLGRHLEDLGSHERENKKGQMMTVVDCYMKERGVSKQETLRKFAELVEDGWKDVNTEWFIYNNGEDGYTTPEKSFAPLVIDLFMDAIVL